MQLFRCPRSALILILLANPGFSDELSSYTYPREGDPTIQWAYEPGVKIEYTVCNREDERAQVFYWEQPQFGTAHDCLLPPGMCITKTDSISAKVPEAAILADTASGVVDSKFQLDGSVVGDKVQTRIWCAQNEGAHPCEMAREGLSIKSVLRLIFFTTQGLCDKLDTRNPFPESSEIEGLTIAATPEFDRWRIDVVSAVRASLDIAFVSVTPDDLLLENADHQELELRTLAPDFSNFKEAPTGLESSGVTGYKLWPEDAPYEGHFYLTIKTDEAVRPVLLASTGKQVFAIVGLGASLR